MDVSYNVIGNLYNNYGKTAKAIQYDQKALTIWKATYGEKHQYLATGYSNIGLAYLTDKDYAKALEYYQKALTIKKSVYGEDHSETQKTLNKIEEIKQKMQNQ